MKVLVADLFPDSAVDRLREAGLECHYDHTLKGAELQAVLEEERPEVLLVKTTRVTADIITAACALELVVRAGTGTEGIDVAEASRQGVKVAHCPGKSAVAVAELVMGLICAADRRLPESIELLRAGKWRKEQSDGLFSKTLGIIGLGDIGQEVAQRARAFGLRLLAFDPQLTKSQIEALGCHYQDSLLSLVSEADVLTFHVPTSRQTKQLVTAELLALCKPNALIINTSHWDLVNEEELLAALDARPEMRYACDCYRYEPTESVGEFRSRLTGHSQVYGTCHIGSVTKQADTASIEEALRIILKYEQTREVDSRNWANRAIKTPANFTVSIRGHNDPGVLGFAVHALADAGANVQEVSTALFCTSLVSHVLLDLFCPSAAQLDTALLEISTHPAVTQAICFPKLSAF